MPPRSEKWLLVGLVLASAGLSGCVSLDDRSVSIGSELPLSLSQSGGSWRLQSAELAISGFAFPFSDLTDCTGAGHTSDQCAAKPVLSGSGSQICSVGYVEKVVPGSGGSLDYTHMWGAFIGFDLANPSGVSVPPVYDAPAHGVIGFAFDFASTIEPHMRVEVATPDTTTNPTIWQPDPVDFDSPLVNGHNQLLLSDVHTASFSPTLASLDPTRAQSLRLHMRTVADGPTAYSFCIGNFSAIVDY